MGRLEAKFDRHFSRDLKRLDKKHVDTGPWAPSCECHVANAGDWLLVWAEKDDLAVFQRTGTHEEIFR